MSEPPVDAPVGWISLEYAREKWHDAMDMDDEDLTSYLLSAYESCVAFAPALADGAEVPESWRLAQVMQARAIRRSLVAGTADNMTADGLTVTVYPLDWTVRQQLRPKTGRPRVG
jgi:hypothetical protein